IASSLDDLLAKAGLHGDVRHFNPSGFETLAFWLTELAPLLLLGGIVGVYVEMKVGGFGVAGAVAATCFVLFFFRSYTAGLAGWEVGIVFCIGLALVVSEIMVHPGTILPGLIGLALVAGAVLWAMTDRYPHQPYLPTAEMLQRPLLNLCITVALCLVL